MIMLHFVLIFILSSPCLCVCGDDHVTCYMGANGDASEHVDA